MLCIRIVPGRNYNNAQSSKARRIAANIAKLPTLLERPVIGSWKKLLEYCHSAMAHAKVEQFRLLFLDNRNALIADEQQQTGTINHTPVYPRSAPSSCTPRRSSCFDNHPSGDPTPSSDDVAMTREVAEIAGKLGITVHDHVVIGKRGHASMRNLGLLGVGCAGDDPHASGPLDVPGQPAVDPDVLAGDVAGAVGGEEGDRRGDLLARAVALHRHALRGAPRSPAGCRSSPAARCSCGRCRPRRCRRRSW